MRFVLNGREIEVADPDARTTLLQYLRANGHTGAKEGCAEGECGACAVVLRQEGDGDRPARYLAVNSCLLLLAMVAGRDVLTVEGLGSALHPVQAALAAAGGSQCGYCTPGFVMSLFADYYRPPDAGPDPEVLSGNLCRCTGYRAICAAVQALGRPEPEDPFGIRLERTERPAHPDGTVPAAAAVLGHGLAVRVSEFLRPESLTELLAAMQAHPGALLVAGGTDVAVELGQQVTSDEPPTLISVERVPDLHALRRQPDALEIGAGLTLTDLGTRLQGQVPLLDELFPLFASRLIRNRATLGGNLATASPIGDAAPVLLALAASVRLVSAGGDRVVPLAQFFSGYRRTALRRGEVMVSVRIPLPGPDLSRFYKAAKRSRDDISTVAAAFALDLDAGGRVTQARLAYGGVAPTPLRVSEAEAVLVGRPWGLAAVRDAQAALDRALQPISDHRGSAAYRKALVASLLEKFYRDTAPPGAWPMPEPGIGGGANAG